MKGCRGCGERHDTGGQPLAVHPDCPLHGNLAPGRLSPLHPADIPEYATMSPEARRYVRLGFALQAWVESGNGPILDAAAQLAQDKGAYP